MEVLPCTCRHTSKMQATALVLSGCCTSSYSLGICQPWVGSWAHIVGRTDKGQVQHPRCVPKAHLLLNVGKPAGGLGHQSEGGGMQEQLCGGGLCVLG